MKHFECIVESFHITLIIWSVWERICCQWFLIIRTVLNYGRTIFRPHRKTWGLKFLKKFGFDCSSTNKLTYQERRCKLIKFGTLANLTKDVGNCDNVELPLAVKSKNVGKMISYGSTLAQKYVVVGTCNWVTQLLTNSMIGYLFLQVVTRRMSVVVW